MEKKQNQQNKKETLKKGYYFTINGKAMTSPTDPLSKKEALELFNTLRIVMIESDDNVLVGINTIMTRKIVIEVIDSEILEERFKDKDTLVLDRYEVFFNNLKTPSPYQAPAIPIPVAPSPYTAPNPFMDPPGNYQSPFRCSNGNPSTEDKKEKFFEKQIPKTDGMSI